MQVETLIVKMACLSVKDIEAIMFLSDFGDERKYIRLTQVVEVSAPLVTHWTLLSALDLHTNSNGKTPWDSSTIEMTTIEVRTAN